MSDPILHNQVIATLGEFGDFDKVSGGKLQIAYTSYTEAGSDTATNIKATYSYTDIVLERAYKPDRDTALRDWSNRFKNNQDTPRSVVKRVQNAQKLVVDTMTYPICKPVGVDMPDGTAGDGSIAMVVVTLKVENEI